MMGDANLDGKVDSLDYAIVSEPKASGATWADGDFDGDRDVDADDLQIWRYNHTVIPGDYDNDGNVDPVDFNLFDACFTGPAVPYDPKNLPPDCTLTPDVNAKISADFDHDGDVDQADFGTFQRCYSGENNPANPNCANSP
jgi:hypothetical protein